MPYSAAALASGAVALVLGALAMPSEPNAHEILTTIQMADGRWLMGSAAFFIASVGLTMGLPAVLSLVPRRGRVLGLVGVSIFAIGTIGTAGYAALLVFVRALIMQTVITPVQIDRLSEDDGLVIYMGVFLIAFYLGETIMAIALLRAGSVARWVPAMMLLHVAFLPVVTMLPDVFRSVQAVVVGVALMGVAVSANDASVASVSWRAARADGRSEQRVPSIGRRGQRGRRTVTR